jgi:hypothetical protein
MGNEFQSFSLLGKMFANTEIAGFVWNLFFCDFCHCEISALGFF